MEVYERCRPGAIKGPKRVLGDERRGSRGYVWPWRWARGYRNVHGRVTSPTKRPMNVVQARQRRDEMGTEPRGAGFCEDDVCWRGSGTTWLGLEM